MMVIEMLLDFKALSIQEVTRRLKGVQDHKEVPHTEPCTIDNKLLYTVEQWRTFEKKKKDEGSGSSDSSMEHRRCTRGGKKKKKGPRA
jgi:hypothetical protein